MMRPQWTLVSFSEAAGAGFAVKTLVPPYFPSIASESAEAAHPVPIVEIHWS